MISLRLHKQSPEKLWLTVHGRTYEYQVQPDSGSPWEITEHKYSPEKVSETGEVIFDPSVDGRFQSLYDWTG